MSHEVVHISKSRKVNFKNYTQAHQNLSLQRKRNRIISVNKAFKSSLQSKSLLGVKINFSKSEQVN